MKAIDFKILSEKPAATVIAPSMIKRRVDAGHFRPIFLRNEQALVNGGFETAFLGDLYSKGNYGSLPDSVDYSETGIVLIRGTDLQSMAVTLAEAVRVPTAYYDKFKKARVKGGDILLLIKGASIDRPDSVAMFPQCNERAIANGSIFILRPEKSKTNPYYLLSFMTSAPFLLQKRRGSSNTGALYNDLDTIKSFVVPIPDHRIQDYIGVKVELAERCRAHALKKKGQAFRIFDSDIAWKAEYEEPLGSHWLQPEYLETRLDLNFNSPKKLRLYEYFKDERIETTLLQDVAEISAMIGWKGLTTEHYVEDGPWLLRGVEIRDGYIDFESLVSVQRDKYDEQPQIHLKHGDVVMTKDGTIGKAIVIPEIHNEMAAGSTVARLRPRKKPSINPYYLEFVINHPVLQIQIQSFATGLAQPHITQEWIAKLRIPRISRERKIADLIASHHSLMTKAQYLVADAKSDVEALIEGTLDTNAILSGKLKPPTWEDIEKELKEENK